MAEQTASVSLTKTEVAASLAAVRAVIEGAPLPLRVGPLSTAAEKYAAALKCLNEETDHAS